MLTDAVTSLVLRYLDPHDLLSWLLVFMAFDVVTGVVASCRERRLNSSIAWVGIWKKVGTALALTILVVIDPFIRAYSQGYDIHLPLFATLGFVGTETLSIMENLGRCGVQTEALAAIFTKVNALAPRGQSSSGSQTVTMTMNVTPDSEPTATSMIVSSTRTQESKAHD